VWSAPSYGAIILEKITIIQVLNKLPVIYGTLQSSSPCLKEPTSVSYSEPNKCSPHPEKSFI
jgi:hypothetical protein